MVARGIVPTLVVGRHRSSDRSRAGVRVSRRGDPGHRGERATSGSFSCGIFPITRWELRPGFLHPDAVPTATVIVPTFPDGEEPVRAIEQLRGQIGRFDHENHVAVRQGRFDGAQQAGSNALLPPIGIDADADHPGLAAAVIADDVADDDIPGPRNQESTTVSQPEQEHG